jgi:hypothetical protein
MHGMHTWTTLADTRRTFRVASDDDHPCPATAPGVEHGTTRTLSMCACGVRVAGTPNHCPGGVLRSIGQSAASCQKQNGTFRGASGASHTRVAQHAMVSPSIGRRYTLLHHTRDGLRTPDDRSRR